MAEPMPQAPERDAPLAIVRDAPPPTQPADIPFAFTLPNAPPREVVLRWQPPVLGSLAVIFGVAALFKATLLLAPLGLLFSLAAVFRRQFGFAAIGAASSAAALLASPAFWALLGLAWLLNYLM